MTLYGGLKTRPPQPKRSWDPRPADLCWPPQALAGPSARSASSCDWWAFQDGPSHPPRVPGEGSILCRVPRSSQQILRDPLVDPYVMPSFIPTVCPSATPTHQSCVRTLCLIIAVHAAPGQVTDVSEPQFTHLSKWARCPHV